MVKLPNSNELYDELNNEYKKKLKGYTKIHSHSNSNTNKNIEINKNINKMPITSYINSVSPVNSYLVKKKKNNDNSYMNKSLKKHIMLTSVNNSSIIYSPKEKDKDKGITFSNNNAHNTSNYESNNYNNMNNNLYINVNKRTSLKNGNIPISIIYCFLFCYKPLRKDYLISLYLLCISHL